MYFIDKWFLKTSSFITQQRYLDVIKALKRIWRYLNVGASVEKGLVLPFESYPILSIKRWLVLAAEVENRILSYDMVNSG